MKPFLVGYIVGASAALGVSSFINANSNYRQSYKVSDKFTVECAKYERLEQFVWLSDCKNGVTINKILESEVVVLNK
jgi:hypothetical protein